MSEIETGGPAFPCEQHETLDGSWNQTFDPGMSLRDWFAGQALAGMGMFSPGRSVADMDGRARWAYEQADAMLKARAALSPHAQVQERGE